jgi:DNA-binding response OmpR family regulator
LNREWILVVDDDDGLRLLMRTLLERAGFAVREAPTGEQALELAGRERPRLVVLDVRLPGLSGYEVCRALRHAHGDGLPIVFVSGVRKESFDRVAGLLIGADDYLVKPFAPDELLARVRLLLRRSAPAARTRASELTGRELEVLRLLAEGLGPQEIAAYLVISPKTVGTHIEHIFGKLGVRSRAQAVALAFRQELVQAPV